ncbi:uncharacterized protein BX664DRAFT_338599 [Halteromyces radiatus]|uniref:uncharacterized protein n=1 Tax=Halteromyces radiatus TaxID=101107 RepID=UPI0022209406|nr:uncharacterized protein BX664DRAFT_338599 [Halteromyces radiatus]KAI8085134.1 hypothetical protein BX664DRAFT_338599 [Halteromyces radiatus]
MSGYKRSKVSFDKDDYYDRAGSSKRAKTQRRQEREESTDFEIDHEESLEPAKQRRGAVAKDAYVSDDEEVGGGAFNSDSENGGDDSDEDQASKKTNDDDVDMFSSTVADEEDDTKKKDKKKKRLGMDDIEGQEWTSRDQESDDDDNQKNKLTAFNMRQEMEEGSFDAQGNYIRNEKDPEAFHDKWMEGISKKDMLKARDAQVRRDQAEQVKEASRQSTLPQTQTDVYLALVEYLLPGESVKDALTTLGKGAHGKIPLWKQKLMAKKNKNKKQDTPVLDEQQAADRQRKVEEMTGLADQLMALGHFTVYDDTFESIVRYLRNKTDVDELWLPESIQRK